MQEMKYLNCPLTYKTASSQFNSTVPGSSDIHLRVSAFASCSFPMLPHVLLCITPSCCATVLALVVELQRKAGMLSLVRMSTQGISCN